MRITKQKFSLIILIVGLVLALIPVFASAAGLVPCGGGSENPCTVIDAFILIARATNFLIAASSLVLVYFIVNHSFFLVVTLGNEESITTHRTALVNAVIGFVLVMMAFIFVNTAVNYILLNGVGEQGGSDKYSASCKIDLTSPWTYLTITNNPCR